MIAPPPLGLATFESKRTRPEILISTWSVHLCAYVLVLARILICVCACVHMRERVLLHHYTVMLVPRACERTNTRAHIRRHTRTCTPRPRKPTNPEWARNPKASQKSSSKPKKSTHRPTTPTRARTSQTPCPSTH